MQQFESSEFQPLAKSTPELENSQAKYSFLQLKLMQKMGFGVTRPETDWDTGKYSTKFEEIFKKKETEDSLFLNQIPTNLSSDDWNSPELQGVINTFISELEKPVVH